MSSSRRGRRLTVTQPDLPPLEEFLPYLEEIWESGRLTNFGPKVRQLEAELASYLRVEHLSLFANGTLALISALKALDVSGEVITTPYSFVATAHSLLWNGLQPVFADVCPRTLTLDPRAVEAAITERTTAILPVHIHGRRCDVAALRNVADRHGLKLLYDAAQAFGVEDESGSIARHGDLSVLSFHATKVYTTLEGGAVVCRDQAMKDKLDHMKNFGFEDEVTVASTGINAKMNELQAAFGLLQLRHLAQSLQRREQVDRWYRELLADIPGLYCLELPRDYRTNYGHFPIFIEPGFSRGRDQVYQRLRDADILARRYFYPLITEFPMYSAVAAELPVAWEKSRQVICLPIFAAMLESDCERVVKTMLGRS